MLLNTSDLSVSANRRWRPATALSLKGRPPLLGWLKDAGSLTERLERHAGQRLVVEVLRQELGRASLSEALTLGYPPAVECWLERSSFSAMVRHGCLLAVFFR